VPDIANPEAGLTRSQAVDKLGSDVTPAMVSMWVARGWLDPQGNRRHIRIVGTDERGARLYRYADLLAAEKHTRRSPQSRRQPAVA